VRDFEVSQPSVHETVKTLEKRGLIERQPGAARSSRLLVNREAPPDLL